MLSSGPDFRLTRKQPRSQIIGATDKWPSARILDFWAYSKISDWPKRKSCTFPSALLQIMISSSPSVFCKRDCRSLQRRVTAGKGRKSGQWGSALDNEDPTMIWGNLDNLPRDARGQPWQHGVQRTFLIFKSHNIAIIASACGGIVINISWLQSDITKCIFVLLDRFCRRILWCIDW